MKTLLPIRPKKEHAELLEKKIISIMKEFYRIIIGPKKISNSNNLLENAIIQGRVEYLKDGFVGKFSSQLSKALKLLGAKWDTKQGSWKIPLSKLPASTLSVISQVKQYNDIAIEEMLVRLSEISSDTIIADNDFSKSIASTIGQTTTDIKKGIPTVKLDLDEKQAEQIKKKYTENLELDIKTWSDAKTIKLRKMVQESHKKGIRYKNIVGQIQSDFSDKSVKHAKFIAQQETQLLNAEIKEQQYRKAGLNRYVWRTLNYPVGHDKKNVRPDHAELDGKIFDWDHPPVTNHESGARNHPGTDFRCRCFAEIVIE